MTARATFTQAALTRAIRAAEKAGYRVGGVKPDGTVLDTNGDPIDLTPWDRARTMEFCGCTSEQFDAFIREGLLPKPSRKEWDKREVDAAMKRLAVRPYGATYSEVYFIELGKFIKIGFSAYAYSRVDTLQTASPYDLKILGTFNGDERCEREVQALFRYLHHRREWFRKSKALLAYIDWIKARKP